MTTSRAEVASRVLSLLNVVLTAAATLVIMLVTAAMPGNAGGAPFTAATAKPAPVTSAPSALIRQELCGRSLGGRCTKGRAACQRGTSEQCARWQRWSDGCNACALGFVACRQKVGRLGGPTCDACRAAHDACEERNRTATRR